MTHLDKVPFGVGHLSVEVEDRAQLDGFVKEDVVHVGDCRPLSRKDVGCRPSQLSGLPHDVTSKDLARPEITRINTGFFFVQHLRGYF